MLCVADFLMLAEEENVLRLYKNEIPAFEKSKGCRFSAVPGGFSKAGIFLYGIYT